jgi:hypothetical protein
MIGEFVRSIDGIEMFGIAALCVSFGAFCAILLRVWRTDRARCETMARLPLDSDDATPSETRG